jgi:Co/Zn/Cd efflux system component
MELAPHSHAAVRPPSLAGGDRRSWRRRLRLALVLSAAFFLLEVAGGLYTRSLALLADAAHMFADIAALTLAYAAMGLADRAPTGRHSFGFYRAEILAAFVNAQLLLVIIPLVHVRGTLLKMSAGELPEITPDNKRSALSEMKQALVQLKEGLSRTSVFAREIGSGHFNAEFQPLSEKDVLGSALLEMRDKLSHAADDDSQRKWSAEGYTKINTILHQNKKLLQKV